MTTDQGFRELLQDAASTGPGTLDTESLDRRLAERRRRRRTGRVGGMLAGVAILAIGISAVLPLRQNDPVDLAGTVALTDVDPVMATQSGEPPLSDGAVRTQPTRLPAGTVRCDPTENGRPVPDGVIATDYCGLIDLTVESGGHARLPEEGDVVLVGVRDGYVDRRTDGVSLTTSDANSMEDTHVRISTDDPTVSTTTLVEILASVPAIASAEPAPGPEPLSQP